MSNVDVWKTLGIAPGASKVEIRRAYRRLARRYHPDLNPGDPEAEQRFKEVQAAYDALTGRQGRKAQQHHPAQTYAEPQRPLFSADDDPFLSILAAYVRRRRGGGQ